MAAVHSATTPRVEGRTTRRRGGDDQTEPAIHGDPAAPAETVLVTLACDWTAAVSWLLAPVRRTAGGSSVPGCTTGDREALRVHGQDHGHLHAHGRPAGRLGDRGRGSGRGSGRSEHADRIGGVYSNYKP